MGISSKRQLSIVLSRLRGFDKPDFRLEQYPTDSNIAAEIAWNAFFRREIEGKVVADLGCGTGVLGLAAALLGAKKVYFVDIDEKALKIAKENMKLIEAEIGQKLDEKCVFLNKSVIDFNELVDTVLQNPPFGIQSKEHADKVFLEKSFSLAPIIYSFHKAESKQFIDAVARDNGFEVNGYWEFDWPLKQSMKFHEKKVKYVKIGCWRLIKAQAVGIQ